MVHAYSLLVAPDVTPYWYVGTNSWDPVEIVGCECCVFMRMRGCCGIDVLDCAHMCVFATMRKHLSGYRLSGCQLVIGKKGQVVHVVVTL